MNYLNPVVKEGLENFIMALGERYRDDPRIGAVEIGIGFAGEPIPYPASDQACDKENQLQAYLDRADYTDATWTQYHKDVISIYADAFSAKKPLLTIINAAYAEQFRSEIVQHAAERSVGLVATSLHSDYYSNHGSEDSLCFWGLITEPGFSNTSETAQYAYRTHWAPMPVNSEKLPIGFEFNNRIDNTGRLPKEGETFSRWAMLNALDKGADYVLIFNDTPEVEGNTRYDALGSLKIWTKSKNVISHAHGHRNDD